MTAPPDPAHPAAPPPHTLKEWEKAEDIAVHFNDLLMRIRTFALPFIGTAIGAASVLASDQPQLDAPWWTLAASAAAVAIVLICSDIQLCREGTTIERLRPTFSELSAWLLLAGSIAAWSLLLWFKRPESLSVSAPVLTFGGLLLYIMYLLDRFYYSALLVGAVDRIEAIERQSVFKLTSEITQATPQWTYTLLPTVLYLMPVLALVTIGLAVLTFSGAQ